jgi:peroxiredoxin
MLGKKSNELRARNEKGEYISLHGLEAPMVVLYIYNLDCEHCMEETPEMLDVYHDWKEEGLEVFALCTNQEEDRWRKYIAEQKLDWHNILDPKYESRYHMKYNIDITPEVYVLDPDRKIVGLNLKPTQLDWLFEREFKKIRGEE